MLKSKTVVVILDVMFFLGVVPPPLPSAAAYSTKTESTSTNAQGRNKFVGKWCSQIRTSAGQVYDDGVVTISDMEEPGEDKVRISHSIRGGPVIGHTMAYPDRIEIQIPLGDDRVAHYNGVLVAATIIEGRFFVTRSAQSHQSRSVVPFDESGTWTAQAGSGG